jgi:hypothetical protein
MGCSWYRRASAGRLTTMNINRWSALLMVAGIVTAAEGGRAQKWTYASDNHNVRFWYRAEKQGCFRLKVENTLEVPMRVDFRMDGIHRGGFVRTLGAHRSDSSIVYRPRKDISKCSHHVERVFLDPRDILGLSNRRDRR